MVRLRPMPDLLQQLKRSLEYQQRLGLENLPVGVRPPVNKLSELKTLEEIRAELGDCKRCPLHHDRKNIVFGNGNPNAELMFIGEAPGRDEDIQGLPFVGRAGQLLDKIIQAMGTRREDVYVGNINKCLKYTTMVQLGDGSWERIGRLVKNKYAGTVMSIGENNELVPKKVIGWYTSPLNDRPVYRLTYKQARKTGNRKCSTFLTGDHPILTERGYVEAQNLKRNDKVATGQGLSKTIRDLIIGSLLGDGHIANKCNYFAFNHSGKQSEYAKFKASLLEQELECIVKEDCVTVKNKVYPRIQCRTRAHRSLHLIKHQFYKNRKIVPKHLGRSMTPIILAIWFLDDGYTRIRHNRNPRAEIATCCFNNTDIQTLIDGLKCLGINAYRIKNRIHLNVEATKRLSEIIGPYTPPSMRYKLHPEVEKKYPFNPNIYKLGRQVTMFDAVEIKHVEHKDAEKTFFCIDVEETHNFVTSGGVVHNCRPPDNRAPLPNEVEACLPFIRQQVRAIRPKVIVCLGSVAVQNLLQTQEKISRLRGAWQEFEGTQVMPTYHPAFLLRNPNMKKPLWEDMQKVMAFLKERKNG